jgi:penicillin V acylase-like amidase (Ntn superfamily)
MRKVIALCFIVIFASPIVTNACTTFFINKNGEMVFGRNYDWITASGMLCSNLRGINKTSMKTDDGTTIAWTSKYGSLSFNQYGKEFPTGGMNEQGLVVELMWLDQTKYPKADKRPAIGVLQWIQYQLDNCSTIDEVIATDKIVRIASVGTTPLHYLIADARGKVATIEFLEGKLTVHRDDQVAIPVLTNDIYGLSATAYLAASTMGAAKPISLGNNSLDRFSQACNMVDDFRKSNSNTESADRLFLRYFE